MKESCKDNNMVDYARKLAVVKQALESAEPAEGILWWPYDNVPAGTPTVMGLLDEAGFPMPTTNNRTTRARIIESLRMLGVPIYELHDGKWPRYCSPPLFGFKEAYAVVMAVSSLKGLRQSDAVHLANKVLSCTRPQDATRIRHAFRFEDGPGRPSNPGRP